MVTNGVLITLLLFGFTGLSCHAQGDLPAATEYVLSKGMVITATNPYGTVTITGGPGAERSFSGKGWAFKRTLTSRDTRWNGSLGLYDPGETFSPSEPRLLVGEGRLFFESESEALRYLYPGSAYSKPVFNNHGLVVSYHVEEFPGEAPMRAVEVWQIYIKGKRPHLLRGGDDVAVTMTGGTIPETATPHPASIGQAVTLGDKEYQPETSKPHK
jgi:hypothetical protein